MAKTCWFSEARFGMFIHFGLSAIPARELSWPMSREKIPSRQWRRYREEFNPDRLDERAWARAAKEAGMRYAVLTAKHHEGFCLFDSRLTEYKATRTPFGRDIARAFVEAFRAEGLRVGFYYSLIDWDHPDYPVDRLHPERDDPAERARPRAWDRYLDYLHGQVVELLTGYGKIDLLWFDFSYDEMSGEKWKAERLVRTARELQPEILLNNRLVAGHEDPTKAAAYGDFSTPEQMTSPEGVRDGEGRSGAWEACVTLNDHWGYSRDDRNFKTPTQVVRLLVECVAKGGNLLLNVGPNARGQIQPEALSILSEAGRWMDANGPSLYGAGRAELDGKPLAKPDWGWYTRRKNLLYAHILERSTGPILLPGLAGRILRARLLADGSEISLTPPYHARKTRSPETNAYLNFREGPLPDPHDTVVALALNDGS